MKMADFVRLKKLITLATSDNDYEALGSFRRATEIIRAYGFTWEEILDKRVTVLAEVEMVSENTISIEEELTDADFELAINSATGSFRDTLSSIYEQWQNGTLSPRQIEVVRNAAERAAERRPAGRWR